MRSSPEARGWYGLDFLIDEHILDYIDARQSQKTMFKHHAAARLVLPQAASAGHRTAFASSSVTYRSMRGFRGFRHTASHESRTSFTSVTSHWKFRMRQRLRISLIICASALAVVNLQDRVPITNRERYCVVSRTVEQWVSPKIRRFKDRQLAVSHDASRDPDHKLLQSIMARLQKSRGQSSWEASLVEDRQRMYAACGHAGAVYITRALLEWCGTEDELAWILSHELSHGIARHRWEVAGKMVGYVLVAPFIGPIPAFIATALYGLHLIRELELEADRMGLSLMKQAGCDPRAAVESLQDLHRLTLATRQSRSFLRRLRAMPPLQTHPSVGIRMREIETCIGEMQVDH